MIIKKCEIDDIEKISEFYDNVIIYLDNHINYPKWKYKIYPSIISVTDNINKGFQYEAIINNEIVASFVLNDDPEGSYEKAKWSKDINKFMVIHGFAIKPELQNKGIGTKILEFCKEEAKRLGYEGIRLDVVPSNIPAKNFYIKNGFNYVSDIDLDRNIDDIPFFSLFEFYF